MGAQAETAEATGAYCPHCHLLVEGSVRPPWPAVPVRCAHCQLLIGVGRSRTAPSGEPGTKGTAAGVFSRRAKRQGEEDDDPPRSSNEVLDGIRAVAGIIGERPERLLMVDYQQLALLDPQIPPLSDVFAAFGSWKSARKHAAEAA
ncbi:MAG: hypothetical protein M3356_04200 [Actinomycetota bacterium]|nr:hypothetical protein [Actinomycetota bacterium]